MHLAQWVAQSTKALNLVSSSDRTHAYNTAEVPSLFSSALWKSHMRLFGYGCFRFLLAAQAVVSILPQSLYTRRHSHVSVLLLDSNAHVLWSSIALSSAAICSSQNLHCRYELCSVFRVVWFQPLQSSLPQN